MADLSLVTAGRLYVVSGVANGHEQYPFEASERINIGTMFRYDATTGKAEAANGTTLAESGQATAAATFAINYISELFLAIDGARQARNALTGLKKGEVDGFDLGSLAFGAKIYLSDTDGRLSDTVGTVATVIGRVRPAPLSGVPSGSDRILAINCPPLS